MDWFNFQTKNFYLGFCQSFLRFPKRNFANESFGVTDNIACTDEHDQLLSIARRKLAMDVAYLV
jgi:hypothetical protein